MEPQKITLHSRSLRTKKVKVVGEIPERPQDGDKIAYHRWDPTKDELKIDPKARGGTVQVAIFYNGQWTCP